VPANGERYITLAELALGLEGLALLRGLFDASDDAQRSRIDEIKRIVAEFDDAPWNLGLTVPERDALTGYASWSQSYDTQTNGLIDLEQPVMDEILASLPKGRILDAACGTGRHAKALAERHDVVGVDQSPEMLDVARAAAPGVTFEEGDFTALTFDDATFDAVVCSLALTHVVDVARPISEFARVTKRGGRVVLSDIHPMAVLTLGQGFYSEGEGRFAFVRNHVHMISSYLDAFRANELDVRRCVEVRIPADPRYGGAAGQVIPDASVQATEGLPMALVWDLEKR
jgi:ubiquinone/menaquinone biosynthesis C-methylase UbiE